MLALHGIMGKMFQNVFHFYSEKRMEHLKKIFLKSVKGMNTKPSLVTSDIYSNTGPTVSPNIPAATVPRLPLLHTTAKQHRKH